MPKVFISYRRQDSAAMAGRIYDRLQAHFGKDAVFMDVDSIPFGADFRQHIRKAVEQCDLMLALIGQNWVGRSGDARRIDDPRDFVRIELEVALERHLTVIPVLIDRATMPAETELPGPLTEFAYHNAIEVDDWRDFHPHVDRLVKSIEELFEQARPSDATPPATAATPATRAPTPGRTEERGVTDGKSRARPSIDLDPLGARTKRADPLPQSQPALNPGPQQIEEPGARKTPADPNAPERYTQGRTGHPAIGEPAALAGPGAAQANGPRVRWLRVCLGILAVPAIVAVALYSANDRTLSKVDGAKPATTKKTEATHLATPAETELSPGQQNKEVTNSIGMKLALVTPGEFLMGSPDTDRDAQPDEKPQHRLQITRPFYLGVTEVSRGQFRLFVDQTGYKTEAEKDVKGGWGWNEETKKFEQDPRYTWQNAGFEQADDHPVANVSWNDAVAFAEWLSRKEGQSFRLPTEAEWEYACRAGTTTRYSCGDDPAGLAEVGNVADGTAKKKYPDWARTIAAEDGFVYTAPVGRYRPNRWGLYDVHGNVWEWCSDWYDAEYYQQSPAQDPSGAAQAAYRVIRGGSWDRNPHMARSAFRGRLTPADRNDHIGFRLARAR
jgi:formylglycine-generating enzyme required for sulfatase activity